MPKDVISATRHGCKAAGWSPLLSPVHRAKEQAEGCQGDQWDERCQPKPKQRHDKGAEMDLPDERDGTWRHPNKHPGRACCAHVAANRAESPR